MSNLIQPSKNNNPKHGEKKLPAFLLTALDHIDEHYIANVPQVAKS